MGQECLIGLALLSIHKNIEINYEKTINIFVAAKKKTLILSYNLYIDKCVSIEKI